MPTILRRLLLFGAPALVAAVNLTHPVIAPPVYAGVLHHLDWWLTLHTLNLVLFPLLGLAAYLLIMDLNGIAATLSKVAIAVFIPVYAGFDALMGIGTGLLVQLSRQLPPASIAVVAPVINAFYDSPLLYNIAAAGSIAWIIAMLAATVAFTAPERRRVVAIVAIISFPIGGWARQNLFLAADGVTITPAWWLVTAGMGLLMLAVGKPRVTAALLTLAGALFGALHVTPTGPLGAACFLVAGLYVEFVMRKGKPMTPRSI
jgi:hypothetical protein